MQKGTNFMNRKYRNQELLVLLKKIDNELKAVGEEAEITIFGSAALSLEGDYETLSDQLEYKFLGGNKKAFEKAVYDVTNKHNFDYSWISDKNAYLIKGDEKDIPDEEKLWFQRELQFGTEALKVNLLDERAGIAIDVFRAKNLLDASKRVSTLNWLGDKLNRRLTYELLKSGEITKEKAAKPYSPTDSENISANRLIKLTKLYFPELKETEQVKKFADKAVDMYIKREMAKAEKAQDIKEALREDRPVYTNLMKEYVVLGTMLAADALTEVHLTEGTEINGVDASRGKLMVEKDEIFVNPRNNYFFSLKFPGNKELDVELASGEHLNVSARDLTFANDKALDNYMEKEEELALAMERKRFSRRRVVNIKRERASDKDKGEEIEL